MCNVTFVEHLSRMKFIFNGLHNHHSAHCTISNTPRCGRRNPCSVVANMLDCKVEVTGLELQSYYYVYFLTFGKSMDPLISPVMG